MKTVSDEQLVRAARRGDGRAFAALVERYATAVKAVAYHIVRDRHLAEDVAQEAFVLAYERLPQLRVAATFGRWVLQIGRNRAVRLVQTRKQALSLDHAAEVAEPPVEVSAPEVDQLMLALMRLPEREQRLMMLRYFHGYDVEEISKITGRPVGTVTKQLSRGYARLRGQLSEVLV